MGLEDSSGTAVKKGRHIIQYPPEISMCVGCNACEVVCALVHEGKVGPSLKRIFLDRDTIMMDHRVYSCQHCEDHPCYFACPKKDEAMVLDKERNLVYINEEKCIGCKLCIKACPYEPKRINYDKSRRKALKCDMCRTRENGPACVEFCQVRCIGLSDQPVPGTDIIPPDYAVARRDSNE